MLEPKYQRRDIAMFNPDRCYVTRSDLLKARHMRFIRFMRPLLIEPPIVADNPLRDSLARLAKVSALFKISLGKQHE